MSETLPKPTTKIQQMCLACKRQTTFTMVSARVVRTDFHYNLLGKPCERNNMNVAVLETYKRLGS